MPFAVYRLEPTVATAGPAAVIEVVACLNAADCCDVDGSGIRDSACTWCACEANTCNEVGIIFADMGGAFGACPSDGFANLFDRNHALTCFAGTNTCESINMDAGGPFGACAPDGFCNIHDAVHALRAFAGTNSCTCSGGDMVTPQTAGGEAPETEQETASLSVVPEHATIGPGQNVSVRVFISNSLDMLQGYQLHLGVSGGTAGDGYRDRVPERLGVRWPGRCFKCLQHRNGPDAQYARGWQRVHSLKRLPGHVHLPRERGCGGVVCH